MVDVTDFHGVALVLYENLYVDCYAWILTTYGGTVVSDDHIIGFDVTFKFEKPIILLLKTTELGIIMYGKS